MDLAQILNNVLAQSGFLEKGSFTGSSDPDDRQMVAIANRTAEEIRDYYNWSGLRNTFEVEPPVSDDPDVAARTVFALPNDFRTMVPQSVWETDGSQTVEWPTPAGRWYLYKYSSFSSGGVGRIRQYGDSIEVETPGNWEPFSFDYISKFPIRGLNNDRKEYFTADTDTWVLDDRLLMLGIQANWAEVKMFPQAGLWKNNYMQKMNEAIARDNGGRVIGSGIARGLRSDPYYPLWRPTGGG